LNLLELLAPRLQRFSSHPYGFATFHERNELLHHRKHDLAARSSKPQLVGPRLIVRPPKRRYILKPVEQGNARPTAHIEAVPGLGDDFSLHLTESAPEVSPGA
jgi:hypothetical protein